MHRCGRGVFLAISHFIIVSDDFITGMCADLATILNIQYRLFLEVAEGMEGSIYAQASVRDVFNTSHSSGPDRPVL